MNHDQIEKYNIVDRYLMGKLFGEEIDQFEEHLIDCPQCIDYLQTARSFRQGLRLNMTQGAGAAKALFFLGLSSKTWAIITSSLLAAAAALLLFAFNHILHLQNAKAAAQVAANEAQQSASEARQAANAAQHRYEDLQQRTASSNQQPQKTENDVISKRQQSETQLPKPQPLSARPRNKISASAQSDKNLQIKALSAERGDADIPEFKQSHPPKDFIILIPLEGESGKALYSATISEKQRLIKEVKGLTPDDNNQLSFRLKPRDFPPGEYHAEVKSEPKPTKSGVSKPSVLGNYPFRVAK